MIVALYARVSTEEQATHGYSIDAQLTALRAWATANGHEVFGEFVDAGVSGKKPYQKRPDLLRFMEQLDSGAKVDALVFCKLDRFYRSVRLYYQAMEVLDRHGVAWVAIQEDYETTTASGRMKVNIMLSVAENEADRTSERVKAVYARKVALGEPINGNVPVGLKIDGKRIVPDEYAPAVVAAFQCYADTGSRNAVQTVLDGYGKHLSLQTIGRLLRNRLYIGEYRDNSSYCEPILSRALFDRVQNDMDNRRLRRSPTGKVYLFSGLITCGICGRKMSGMFPKTNKYAYYHCENGHRNYKDCPNATYLREDLLESEIIRALAEVVKGTQKTVHPPRTPAPNKAAINRKLARLRDLYIEGDLPRQQYLQRRDALTAMIREKKEDRPRIVLGDQFEEEYMKLTRPQKQVFFRRVVERITVGENAEIDVIFADSYRNHKATDVDL